MIILSLLASCLVLMLSAVSMHTTFGRETKGMLDRSNSSFGRYLSGNLCPASNLYLEKSFRCNPGHFKVERTCNEDTLEMFCDKPLLIAVHSSLFGWHARGRSLRCSGKFPSSPEVCPLTCLADQLRASCNGRRRCDVDSSNETLQDLVKCGHPYKTFLEITYICLERQMLKSLEQGKLDDEDPCAEKEKERKLRGNRNSTEQQQNTSQTNSQRKTKVTEAPVMTTFYPISNDGIDDDENGDDDGNDDEDFQASGDGTRNDPIHDMKDINYSSTESFTEVSSYDVGYVTSANRDGIDDDDKDIDFINVVDDDDDDENENDDDDDDGDDKYIKIEDEHVNPTLRSGIDSNTTDAAEETIDDADDDPISTYEVTTNDLDSTSTREDDDDDDGEGIYFTTTDPDDLTSNCHNLSVSEKFMCSQSSANDRHIVETRQL